MKITNKKTKRKGFTLVELLVVIAIIAGLAAIAYGPIMKFFGSGDQTAAIAKGKNLHAAMLNFANKSGKAFPNDDNARASEDASSVEGVFNMLISRGAMDNEVDVWSSGNSKVGIVKTSEPDEDGTVDKGECAWGYVKGLTLTSVSTRPLMFDSCKSKGQFETAVWEGQAIVVYVSGAVRAEDIDYGEGNPLDEDGNSKQGNIKNGNDKDIFSILPDHLEVLVPSGS